MERLKKKFRLPLIPIRELVAFPHTIIPILIGRKKSRSALISSEKEYDNFLFLATQKNQTTEYPKPEEINTVGVVAKVEKKMSNNKEGYRVLIQGLGRGKIVEYIKTDEFFEVVIAPIESSDDDIYDKNEEKISTELIGLFKEYLKYRSIKLPGIFSKLSVNSLSGITDIIASVLTIPIIEKQKLLEETNSSKRGIKLLKTLKSEIERLKKTSGNIISNEEPFDNDIENYKKKIEKAKLPKHTKNRAFEELERLKTIPPFSAEYNVSKSYLDWLLSIPWDVFKEENIDIEKAHKILDEDHYGLKKVKERILDYLAVKKLVKKPIGEILCFVGPPGVGKSSLSKSIARALDKPFVRISLGGVRDEAEIRGHRRTYVGSYPGQIVKGLKKAKVMNPVFLLDEIDKLSSDYKGDPSSALLEALDPEQNNEFVDHYLDLEIDLSKVFFITTANTTDTIPPALKDRMEIIELPGYTEREKLNIAKNYLLKKSISKTGLNNIDIKLNDKSILKIINEYTSEAGVRNLERNILRILRKIARKVVSNEKEIKEYNLKENEIEEFLGVPKYNRNKLIDINEPGVAIGLAWTIAGGDILVIESKFIKGKGELILTGRLGEVMKESSSTALSYVKVKLFETGFNVDSLKDYNIHIHLPEGAVPKEGPSAGITLAVSMISLLTGIKVKNSFAMTGEITLRGKVLPVGGIKEKLIAAHRYKIKNIIIPEENKKDYLEDIPSDIKDEMKIYPVSNMDEVLKIILEKPLISTNINNYIMSNYTNNKVQ